MSTPARPLSTRGGDTMPGGTDKVNKVQGDVAVAVDATTVDVYHLLSKWHKEVKTRGPQVPFIIPIPSA
jgi:hypothetical protein